MTYQFIQDVLLGSSNCTLGTNKTNLALLLAAVSLGYENSTTTPGFEVLKPFILEKSIYITSRQWKSIINVELVTTDFLDERNKLDSRLLFSGPLDIIMSDSPWSTVINNVLLLAVNLMLEPLLPASQTIVDSWAEAT